MRPILLPSVYQTFPSGPMVTPPGGACVLNRRLSPSGMAGMLNQQAAVVWPAQLHCRGLARPKDCVLTRVIQFRRPESGAGETHTVEPPVGKRARPAENEMSPSAAVVIPPSAGRLPGSETRVTSPVGVTRARCEP